MNAINRQKFLAELAKLLAFMYEEDRLYALEMYERMFDIAGDDEQWLIQHLMSPTRQAVIIARAYNAKERKLSVNAQWKDGEETEEEDFTDTPPFVLAINKIFDDLFPDDTEELKPAEDQVSFFELGLGGEETPKKPKMPKAAVLLDSTQEFPAITDTEEPEEDALSTSGTSSEAIEEPNDLEQGTAEVQEHIQEHEDGQQLADAATAAESAEDQDDSSEVMMQLQEEDTSKETAQQVLPQKKKKRSIEELLGLRKNKNSTEQQGENLLRPLESEDQPEAEKPDNGDPMAVTEKNPDNSVISPQEPEFKLVLGSTDDELSAQNVESKVPTEEILSETNEEPINTQKDEIIFSEPEKLVPEKADEGPVIKKPARPQIHENAAPTKIVRNTPKFILFLIIAIPATLIVFALLLVPTLLCMGLTCGLVSLGAVLVASAFSGFAVLADILVLLGAAAVALALGLLTLWIAVWLIESVMAEVLNWVRGLCTAWCYKEVPAE